MDQCHTNDLISLDVALEKLLSQTKTVTDTEIIPLTSSAQRIIATDLISLSMSHHLIILLWMAMAYVLPIGMGKHQCQWQVNHLPATQWKAN